jgi:hypothetical protein
VKHRLWLTLAVAAIVASLAGASMAPAAGAAAPQTTAAPAANTVTGLTQQLTGTQGDLAYNLTATITKLVNQNGQLLATGTLTGTVTNTVTGLVTNLTNQPFSVPVTGLAAGNSCTILDLTLGPLHLDLLGLVVDLNQVHLTITGQQGPGNLLGNLLCGLANALNGGGGGGIANLLNRLLGL